MRSGIDNLLAAAYRNCRGVQSGRIAVFGDRRHGFTAEEPKRQAGSDQLQDLQGLILARLGNLGFSDNELTEIKRDLTIAGSSQPLNPEQRMFRVREVEAEALIGKIQALREEIEANKS